MTIDPIWDATFQQREWGRWPNEELVRFVSRNFSRAPDRHAVRVLEVGCAAANNVWFLAKEGYSATGIDGAPAGIERGKARLAEEGLTADLRVADAKAIGQLFPAQSFDAVVDVGCLQCNRFADVVGIVAQMALLAKPGGKIFSLIVADDSVGVGRGRFVEPGTFSDITAGPLQGTGLNHFFSLDEVREAFRPFAPLSIEYVVRSYGDRDLVYKTWVVTGPKAA